MTGISTNRRIKLTALFTLTAVVAVCGGCAPTVQMGSQAHGVVVARQDPPTSSRNLGIVVGTHGNGCGFIGLRGNEQGAMAVLKNNAAEMGADYVQIERTVKPYRDGECLHNEYRIEGTSYVSVVESLDGAVASGR